MPDIPFAERLPAPVHRALLRGAEVMRRGWWAIVRPRLRGCALVVFDSETRVLLVRHSYRKQDEWHVPTGGVGKREDVLVAARRELAEEVGLRVDTFTTVHTEWIQIGGARNHATVLLARSNDAPQPDFREIAEARFFPHADLPPSTPEWALRYIALARAAID